MPRKPGEPLPEDISQLPGVTKAAGRSASIPSNAASVGSGAPGQRQGSGDCASVGKGARASRPARSERRSIGMGTPFLQWLEDASFAATSPIRMASGVRRNPTLG